MLKTKNTLKTQTKREAQTLSYRFKDAIFFDKCDLKPGTKLYHSGRRIATEVWEVLYISSLFREKPEGKKNYSAKDKKKILRKVNEVRHLTDRIVLANSFGQRKSLSFSYLCYSALWRL